MSRSETVTQLIRHHLRSSPGGGIVVAALVFLLAFLTSGGAIALGVLGDATVRNRLSQLSTTATDVSVESFGLPGGPGENEDSTQTWPTFMAQLEDIRTTADAPLDTTLGDPIAVTRTTMTMLQENTWNSLSVGFSPAFADEVTLVDGRLPDATPFELFETTTELVGIEVVVSVATAEELQWRIGETRAPQVANPVVFTLVGVFEPKDPDAGFWQEVTSVIEPTIIDDGNLPREVHGTAFAHPDSLFWSFMFSNGQSTLAWYPIDPDAIASSQAERTVTALQAFASESYPVGNGGFGSLAQVKFKAPIVDEVRAAITQQASTVSIIAMILASLAGVAFAVVVLGCRLILYGRAQSLRLLSARGASIRQLRGLLAVEGVVVGIMPAILGAVAATTVGALALGTPASVGTVLVGAALGLIPLGILVGLAHTAGEQRVRADIGRTRHRLRLVADGLVVGLAAVALMLLLVRGYSRGVDPLLAATPFLLSLVACLVTLRLYPLPLQAVFRRAQAGTGHDAFLGAARALREPSIGLTPVLALVVGVSVAVSSGVLLSVVQVGAAQASEQQVGADLRLSGVMLPPQAVDQTLQLAGVSGATGLSGAYPGTVRIGPEAVATSVFVTDFAQLREVQGNAYGLLPDGFQLPETEGLQVILSAPLAAQIGAKDYTLNGVSASTAASVAGKVPLGTQDRWVLIDAADAEAVLNRTIVSRVLLVSVADSAEAADVTGELHELFGADAKVDSVADVAARIDAGPAVQGVRWALAAATALAALLSALAIVMTLTLASGARTRVLALLRTLGAPARSGTRLTLWEVVPPALAAMVAGGIFGALVPLVVMAAVDLRPFTGSSAAPAYVLDPVILGVALGGFIVVAVLVTGLSLWVSRRTRTSGVLRTVEEG